jgi:hypothetical protein
MTTQVMRTLTYEVVSNPVLLRQYLESPIIPGNATVSGDLALTGDLAMAGQVTASEGIATADGGALKSAVVNLTAAEIKAVRATPAVLVAAPGAGKMIVPLSVTLHLTAGTNALTETADNLIVGYHNGTTQVGETIETTGFIDQAADTITNWFHKKDGIVAAANAVNKNLALKNSGDGEYGGNAAGDAALRVVVVYQVVNCG